MGRPAGAPAASTLPSCCCAHELWRDRPDVLAHYRERFGAILVDEFQDTNSIQYAWLRLLAGSAQKLFVVGDDDQSIYGWRGARVENIQDFQSHYPDATVVRLEQNYRSTGNILRGANAVIANNPTRLGKRLWTEDGDGEPIRLYGAFNEGRRARFVIERIRTAVDQGSRRASAPSCTAPRRSPACLRRPCCRPASPTASMAGCDSSNAPRSRMRWPTCASYPTATMTRRSNAQSTSRRAASARTSTRCAPMPATSVARCGRRPVTCCVAVRCPRAANALRGFSTWSKIDAGSIDGDLAGRADFVIEASHLKGISKEP